MHRRIKLVLVPLGLTVSLFLLGIGLGYRAQSQTRPAYKTKKAFVAHLRVLQFGNAQQPPHIQNEVYALRSDGSYVRRFETTSPKGEVGWAVDIIDIRNGKYTLVEPFTRTAVTFYRSETEMQNELRAKITCNASGEMQSATSRVDSISDTILDQKVVQVIEKHTGSKREVTIEKWVAPDLDCYPLRKSEWSQSGSHNETEVTKLEIGDPPESILEVPPGFLELSPLQMETLYTNRYPGYSLWGAKVAAAIEERYAKSQSKRGR